MTTATATKNKYEKNRKYYLICQCWYKDLQQLVFYFQNTIILIVNNEWVMNFPLACQQTISKYPDLQMTQISCFCKSSSFFITPLSLNRALIWLSWSRWGINSEIANNWLKSQAGIQDIMSLHLSDILWECEATYIDQLILSDFFCRLLGCLFVCLFLLFLTSTSVRRNTCLRLKKSQWSVEIKDRNRFWEREKRKVPPGKCHMQTVSFVEGTLHVPFCLHKQSLSQRKTIFM